MLNSLKVVTQLISIFSHEINCKCNKPFKLQTHPDFLHQIKQYNKIDEIINQDLIEKEIIIPLGFKIKSFKKIINGGGVINHIYFIDVLSLQTNIISHWLLRISNSHSFWINHKTKWEITILNIIKNHCKNIIKILIPNIIDYSSNINNKPLIGFEYILFQREINCETLENIQNKLSYNEKENIFKELCNIVHSIRNISLNKNKIKIGTFKDILMNEHNPILCDGPYVGPFTSIKEFFSKNIEFTIKQLNYEMNINCYNHSKYKYHNKSNIKNIIQLLKDFMKSDTILNLDIQYLKLQKINQISFINHNDLNPSNILIDKNSKKICCIIDWESSFVNPFGKDVNELLYYHKKWKLDCLDLIPKPTKFEDTIMGLQLYDVKQYACDSWFYTVSWWSPFIRENRDIKCYIQDESKTGLTNLQNILQNILQGCHC